MCTPSGKQQFPLSTPDGIQKSKVKKGDKSAETSAPLINEEQIRASETPCGFRTVPGVAKYPSKKAGCP